MAENKTIELNVETNLGSLRSQLRQAQAEVAAMADKFGATSVEAAKAAKRAAELKDRIQDAKNLTAAFNPEAKFAAIGQAVGAAAGGFTAFQGALGLAGVESENLQQQLLKVQSALALSQGLEQLGGLADALKNVKTVGVNAFNSIKTAIGGTGIGLLVVALGTIYAYWDDITKSVKASFPAFENIGTIFNKIKEVAFGVGNAITNFIVSPFKAIGKLLQGDFSGALDEIKKGINVVGNYQKGALDERQAQQDDANKKRLEALIKQKDDEIAVEKAKGKDTYKLELENYKRKKELAKGNQEELQKLRQEEKILIATHQKELKDAYIKHQEEIRKAQEELAQKELERLKKQREDSQKMVDDIGFMQTKSISDYKDAKDRQLEVDNNYYEEVSALADKQLNENAQNREKERQAENDLRNAKFQIAQQSINSIISLNDFAVETGIVSAKKGFQVSKGLAITQATISTIEGVVNALTAKSVVPEPFGQALKVANAVAIGAAGAANIAKISHMQFNPNGNQTPNSTIPSATSQSVAPTFNITGGNQTSQLLQGLQAQPLKAYVVSSDITSAQLLDQKAIKTSVL